MPFTESGAWYPNLSGKQLEIFNSYDRYTLASGPKRSGKTIGNIHRIIRHLWEIDGARVGVFCKTLRNAQAGGVWNDLTDPKTGAIHEWIQANIGLTYTSRRRDGTWGPRIDGMTRMQYFKIRNMHGGESEAQLHSLDYEGDVEQIAKGTRFSMFYFAELSNFTNPDTFRITSDQLRMPGVSYEDHMWLADTNPSDEGPDSWIYKLWYVLREDPTPQQMTLKRQLRLIEVMIDDNPYLSDVEKDDLREKFADDPDLYARYIEGKWVHAVKGALFKDQFKPSVHVLGDTTSIDPKEWRVLLPSEGCYELLTGWDMGDRYHSVHVGELVKGENGPTIQVIDEVCFLNPDIYASLEELSSEFLKLYEFWNSFLGKKPMWHHWSDAQALTSFRAGAATYDHNLVFKYTNDQVDLQAAPKFPGSVKARVRMLKTLLHENRLLVSAKCHHTIQMLKSLKNGTGTQPIAPSKYRHVFDSLTYMISGEEPAALLQDIAERVDKVEDAFVSISL